MGIEDSKFTILGDGDEGKELEKEIIEIVSENKDLSEEVYDGLTLAEEAEVNVEEVATDIIDERMDLNITDEKSSLYTEDDKKVLHGLKVKGILRDIDLMRAHINEAKNDLIMKTDENDKLLQIVKEYSLTDLKAMSLEEIDALYEKWGVDVDKDNINYGEASGDKEERIFRKDILIFYRETYDSELEYDKIYEQHQAELNEINDEINKIMEEYGGLYDFMESKFKKVLEDSAAHTTPEQHQEILNAFNDGLTLDFLKDYVKSNRAQTLLWSYRNDKESNSLYKKYLREARKIKLNADITKFSNMEKDFLGEEYNERPNIVLFSLIHYVANRVPKNTMEMNRLDQIRTSRFHINLVKLVKGEFKTTEEKELFLNGLKQVVVAIG